MDVPRRWARCGVRSVVSNSLVVDGGPQPIISVCVKWVDLHPEIDPLTGTVSNDRRRYGFSQSDQAAFEVGLRLAAQRGHQLRLIAAAPPAVEPALRDLAASGASSVCRVDVPEGAASGDVAAAIAFAVRHDPQPLVVCGDYSLDRGSGSVPGLIAHHLALPQALGLIEVNDPDALASNVLRVTRRLDGGRREHLEVTGAAVLSVEGSVATLRRAPLSGVLAQRSKSIDVIEPGVEAVAATAPNAITRDEPIRPRARVLTPPAGSSALERVVELTGALVDRTPPRRVVAEPDEAADVILAQLRSWGYLDGDE